MNEQFVQKLIEELGNNIAQQSVDLAALRLTNRELTKEIERLNKELAELKNTEEAKGADSVEQ